jgi:predicted benzoate:H+ symporter BenE
MSARTSASVAYLCTFDDVSAVGLAGAVFGLAACSELGLETCSLIFQVD